VVLGAAALGALAMLGFELGFVAVRIAVFCAIVAGFATSFLLHRYERAAQQEFATEQEARRRQEAEVDQALGELRNRLAQAERRVAQLAGLEGRLSELAGTVETTTRRPAVDPYAIATEVSSVVRGETERLREDVRDDVRSLRDSVLDVNGRQQSLESMQVGLQRELDSLREDLAHELSQLAGRQRRTRSYAGGGYSDSRSGPLDYDDSKSDGTGWR
jgi:predicted  nucleic acid-binding Zn-ribbon protein